MKQGKRVKKLKARREEWERMSSQNKSSGAFKRPGSVKK